jgi:hypothetical protein
MSFDSGGFFNSTSNPETNTYNQNAGFSEVGGSATSINLVTGKKSKGTNNITLLDGGAIERAFAFGGDALKQVELAGNNTRSVLADAIDKISQASRSEQENVAITLGKWALIAAIAYFGFKALRG